MSDANVELFVPPAGSDIAESLDGADVYTDWPAWKRVEFAELYRAMQARVGNPRRRLGGDVRRIGPVIFDPCQRRGRNDDIET
jgi:hypothetical protein